ncbi:MAG: serine hydrolase, partial [Marinilabiliales bacterium]
MKKKSKQRFVRIVLLFGTIISLYFVPWTIIMAWIKPLPETVKEQVDDAISMGFDGIIVYVDQSGIEQKLYAAGFKNKENKIPADPNSLFKIASVGKLYLAVAVSKLVRKGKLSLDSSIIYYLPELDGRIENGEDITIRMLVKH